MGERIFRVGAFSYGGGFPPDTFRWPHQSPNSSQDGFCGNSKMEDPQWLLAPRQPV